MLSLLLVRLQALWRRPAPAPAGAIHLAVCPPRRPRSAALGRWLTLRWNDSSLTVPRPASPALCRVRQEFLGALHDIGPLHADSLHERIEHARTMRELWHLRPEVFDRVAHRHDESEAHARLAALNRHFPTRAPLSGFGALDTLSARARTGK
jgi:hypothetical protein